MTKKQTSTDRFVSFHLDRCGIKCPNNKVCYLLNRKKTDFNINYINLLEQSLKNGYTTYESISNVTTLDNRIKYIKNYKNYSVTVSYLLFLLGKSLAIIRQIPVDQIQVSVYSKTQIEEMKKYQKLFLVKDNLSMQVFTDACSGKFVCSNIHFLFLQDYLDKNKVYHIIKTFNNNKNNSITIDSCLHNYLLNGTCQWDEGIDISSDGTMRSCVYSCNGMPIPKNAKIDNLVSHKLFPAKCIYIELFGG